MKNSTKGYLNAAACFLLFLTVQLVGGAVALLLTNAQQLLSGGDVSGDVPVVSPQWLGVGLLVADLLAVLLLWATKLIRRSPLPRRRPPMPRRWAVPVAAFLLLSMGLNIAVNPLELDDAGVEAIFEGMRGNMLCLLTLTVVGPVVEELIFREGIQRQLKSAGVSSAWAIGISAALFGVAHGNMAQAVMAVLLGIVLGLLYERTGDIRLSAPAHILNNTLGVLLLYFPEVEDGFDEIPALPLVCGGLLLAVSAVYILIKWWAAPPAGNSPETCE